MECSPFPFIPFPGSSSPLPAAKLPSILWDWTGLQQGSHLAALAVPPHRASMIALRALGPRICVHSSNMDPPGMMYG